MLAGTCICCLGKKLVAFPHRTWYNILIMWNREIESLLHTIDHLTFKNGHTKREPEPR